MISPFSSFMFCLLLSVSHSLFHFRTFEFSHARTILKASHSVSSRCFVSIMLHADSAGWDQEADGSSFSNTGGKFLSSIRIEYSAITVDMHTLDNWLYLLTSFFVRPSLCKTQYP